MRIRVPEVLTIRCDRCDVDCGGKLLNYRRKGRIIVNDDGRGHGVFEYDLCDSCIADVHELLRGHMGVDEQ